MLLVQFIFPTMTDLEHSLPIYMYATGSLSHQYPVNRPEGHPGFQWIQCTKGEGVLIIDNKEYIVSPNQGMFLFPEIPHQYYPTKEPWEVYWMILCGSQIESIAKRGGLIKSGVYTISSSEILLTHLKNAFSIAKSGKPLVGLECAKLTYSLLLDIIRCTSNSHLFNQDFKRLQPVLDYIEKNFARVITLSDLSEKLGITSQHLCLLFRSIVNMSPIQYINRVRINKSKELMFQFREKNISEISQMVGFETPGYFTRWFKRYEGITPNTFKSINGL